MIFTIKKLLAKLKTSHLLPTLISATVSAAIALVAALLLPQVSWQLAIGCLIPAAAVVWFAGAGTYSIKRVLWSGNLGGHPVDVIEKRAWFNCRPVIREISIGGNLYSRVMFSRNTPALIMSYFQQAADWWLGESAAPRILMLGVAGGGVIRCMLESLPDSRVTGIELEAEFIKLARRYFLFDVDPARCNLIAADAADFVAALPSSGTIELYDLICCDIFDGGQPAPPVYDPEFWTGCARLIGHNGLLTINLLGVDPVRLPKIIDALRNRFASVTLMTRCHGGAAVVLASNDSKKLHRLTANAYRIFNCRVLLEQ